jgi:hypothetical protein
VSTRCGVTRGGAVAWSGVTWGGNVAAESVRATGVTWAVMPRWQRCSVVW